MTDYYKELKTYLKEHEPNLGYGDCETLLDTVFWDHTERNPIVSEKSREIFRDLVRRFGHLTVKEDDAVFQAVNALCLEHEKLAFFEGFRTGAWLMMEAAEREWAGERES